MRVVVTGATGNVGTAVLRALSADATVDSILGLARRRPTLELDRVTWAEADMAKSDLARHFEDADAVVHLAWLIQPSRNERETRAVNVDGSARVLAAVAAAGVRSLVYASSVGAYSPGPKDRRVAEDWATGGVATSFYSRHKAEVERLLDAFEHEHPEVRLVRLRPGLIFQRGAATGIRRLFAGPLLPRSLVRPRLIPVLPVPGDLAFQAVHSDDVAQAYRLAVLNEDASGAYNVAAEPVLDGRELGRLLGARPVSVPARALRAAAALTWRLRLQPTEPGWLDMALAVPLMDTSRARGELGWAPKHSSGDALLELIEGMRRGEGLDTPPLAPRTSGPLRSEEFRTGVGRTST